MCKHMYLLGGSYCKVIYYESTSAHSCTLCVKTLPISSVINEKSVFCSTSIQSLFNIRQSLSTSRVISVSFWFAILNYFLWLFPFCTCYMYTCTAGPVDLYEKVLIHVLTCLKCTLFNHITVLEGCVINSGLCPNSERYWNVYGRVIVHDQWAVGYARPRWKKLFQQLQLPDEAGSLYSLWQ